MKSNAQRLFSFALLFMATVTTSAFGDTNQPAASESDYSIKLYYGKETVLSQPAIQTLYSTAMMLLKTSNFNSSKSARDPLPQLHRPMMHWDVSEIEDDYRLEVSGKYLLISFKEPQNIKTVGGEVSVREIVIGLNEHFGRNELFTIDDEGRVISHAKYSGSILVNLLQIVKKIAANT